MATAAEIVSEMFDVVEETINNDQDKFVGRFRDASQKINSVGAITLEPREVEQRTLGQRIASTIRDPASQDYVVPALNPAEYQRRLDELQDQTTERTLALFRQLMPESTTLLLDEGDLKGLLDHELGTTGVAADAEAGIWARDTARIDAELRRGRNNVSAMMASRGFALPGQTQTFLTELATQNAQDRLAEAAAARTVAKTDMELRHRIFVFGQFVRLRSGVIQSALDLMRVVVGLATKGTDDILELERYNASLYKLRRAYQEFRQGEWEWERLGYDVDRIESKHRNNVDTYALKVREIEAKVKLFADEVRGMATQLAATMNAIHGSASISGSAGMSVGYNYNNDTTDTVPSVTSA